MNSFIVGFVLYKPNISKIIETTRSLGVLAERTVLFNNGTGEDDLKVLTDSGFIIIGQGENKGIATALNAIMKYVSNHFTEAWVFVSDQDAQYSKGILNEYDRYTDDPSIGMISPCVIKEKEGFISNNSVSLIKRCPTSGMAMRISDWEEVGKYNDELFIDYVDYDMCQKINILGKKIIRVNNTYLLQSLGNSSKVRWLYSIGIKMNSNGLKKMAIVFNHSPKRNYYFVRNSVIYLKSYKKEINFSEELYFIVKWEIKKLIFEKKRFKQLYAIIHGLKDGILYRV